MIDYEKDGDGIAHIVWNNPDGPVNVKNDAAIAAFAEAVDRAIADETVKGALVRSAKRDFVAGGDLMALYAVRTLDEAESKVQAIGACLRRMERSGKPFVAVLNGSALGGGLELAMACHRRIAADAPHLKLGQPEVTLGLIPGAGGTQRLPRLIGIAPAARMLLEGKPIGVQEALKLGLVDAVAPAEQLVEVARAWVLNSPDAQQPWDRKGFEYPDFEPQSLKGRAFFFNAWPQLRRKTPPGDFAPGALLQVLGQGLERDIDAGLAIERRHFVQAVVSASAKNRIRSQFIAGNAARKQKRRDVGTPPFEPRRVGVVGAGLMGGGIALVCARAGLQTVLIDRDLDTATNGRDRIARTLDGSVERKLMTAQERDAILSRIEAGADFGLLKGCEVVVEAVIEVADAKTEVFNRVVAAAGPDVLLATNTSTLSITGLGRGIAAPQNLIGLHFFAPVDRMALVEVIMGRETSSATMSRSLDLLKRLRKTAVVVNDGPGFYTSRVVAAYTREALHMLNEGISPAIIDNAAVIAGFPIGPLAMGDLTSYDLLTDILCSLASKGQGTASDSQGALAAAERLVTAGRVGRKGAGGVYEYTANGKRIWEGLSRLFPPAASQPDADEVAKRLLHVQSLETVHAMDEGVASDPLELDAAAVLGWSYPGWRGGVLAHIDDVGPARFVAECDAFAARFGKRFAAPASLRERAASGAKFHANGEVA
ncbi:3-hydroxyacyl-CoA dehydrogenase NAD-binding domain-containing protein [uncultured Pseudacidovorax sp.]|uniref:3-hydroxyacyl-CoA dehydrogenase NAD-binding domain-containing protein n=1 Tax=uncultured Pseudacidovorax sp. TaxID=679313 RepID=UPI0025E4E014|nr:3-hydroxyacyl-CoA dehydrogenase NAD-binding domain-containing protein [uncultured Pseudacidovorax sp.]